jgi:hypothetical protein
MQAGRQAGRQEPETLHYEKTIQPTEHLFLIAQDFCALIRFWISSHVISLQLHP